MQQVAEDAVTTRYERDPRRNTTSRGHVVLAEDNHELRRMLTAALRKDGFSVFSVGSGFELLEHLGDMALGAQAIDLIVTDLRMPGVTGLAIVEGLRHGHLTDDRQIPILLITAFGDAKTHEQAERLGAVMLDKPFDLDDFRHRAADMVAP